MQCAFHWIPARGGNGEAETLNAFLRSHRIIHIEKRFSDVSGTPGWAICVEYLDGPASAGDAGAANADRKRVDYREVLDEATFKIFAALRACRKGIAESEGVPIYVVMTNEQMAAVAERRCATLHDLGIIDGMGDARIKKYGERLLEALHVAVAALPLAEPAE